MVRRRLGLGLGNPVSAGSPRCLLTRRVQAVAVRREKSTCFVGPKRKTCAGRPPGHTSPDSATDSEQIRSHKRPRHPVRSANSERSDARPNTPAPGPTKPQISQEQLDTTAAGAAWRSPPEPIRLPAAAPAPIARPALQGGTADPAHGPAPKCAHRFSSGKAP
jgi:hypothetical protein